MNAQQRLQAQPAQHPAAHLQHAPPVAPPVVNQQPQRVPPPVAIAPGANPLHQQPLTHRITFHELPEEEKRANRPRFEGYRVFTRWIASDQTYFLIRKFTSLNVRIILSLQDEIVELEQQLTELDEDWSRDPLPASVNYPIPNLIHNGTFRQDVATMRTQLLTSLTEKVFYYSEALLSFPIFLASLVRYSNLVELVHCTLFGLVYSLSLRMCHNASLGPQLNCSIQINMSTSTLG
jgi:hypothetical protein